MAHSKEAQMTSLMQSDQNRRRVSKDETAIGKLQFRFHYFGYYGMGQRVPREEF